VTDTSLDITVLIATRNESANMKACLHSLVPVRRVLVVDSGSTDETAEYAVQRGAEVVQFRWNGQYPRKRQWALDNTHISTRWVLFLDADESVSPELWMEIRTALSASNPAAAYLARKAFHFMGREMRFGGFSHAAICLMQRDAGHFENLLPDCGEQLDMEVHERLVVDGFIGHFDHALLHRDAKGLDAYVARHHAYASWEAELRYRFITTGRYGENAIQPRWCGNTQERRRFLKLLAIRLPFEPAAWFVYHYVLRGGFLEGKRGWVASRIRYDYIREVRSKIRAKMGGSA